MRRSGGLDAQFSGNAVPAVVHETLRTPGAPLDGATREAMECRFAHDFSQVRVHSDDRAAAAARAVGANAFAVGQRIVFGAGQYQPVSAEGRRLLIHELTHTVQQRGSPGGSLSMGASNSPCEREAEQAASTLAGAEPKARPVVSPRQDATGLLQRDDGKPAPTPPPAGPYDGYQPREQPPPPPPPPPPPSNCLVGDVCRNPIPGSSWEYAHKSQAQEAQNQQKLAADPKAARAAGARREAVAVEKAIGSIAPRLIDGVKGVFVNPALASGGQIGDCSGWVANPAAEDRCVEVSNALELEATTYNTSTAPTVGGRPRTQWEANLRRVLTHEMTHYAFEKSPTATGLDQVTEWELDELNAILSEISIVVDNLSQAPKPEAERQADIQRALDSYITRPGESIRGTITKMRCLNPCNKVNTLIRGVYAPRSAAWSAAARTAFLAAVNDSKYNLQWPK